MTFDKWFNSQDTLIKVILLIIPFVGWIVELLVRLSVMLRKQDVISSGIPGIPLYRLGLVPLRD